MLQFPPVFWQRASPIPFLIKLSASFSWFKNAFHPLFICRRGDLCCGFHQGPTNKSVRFFKLLRQWIGIASANDDHVFNLAGEGNCDTNHDSSIHCIAIFFHSNATNGHGIDNVNIHHHLHQVCRSKVFQRSSKAVVDPTSNKTNETNETNAAGTCY